MRYIKRSNENSFKIGRELCALFCILYSEFKKNSMFSTDNTWDTFTSVNGFDHMILTRFISGSVDFPKYFSKCNYKILKMDPRRLSSFFRGYYINDINLFSTNINELNSTNKYFVLYDTHYHYLLFIYNYLEARGVHIQLNDTADKYSINEDSDSMCYKLIFEKKTYDFIDPIRSLLNFLYTEVEYSEDCFGEDDVILFERYLSYVACN